MPLVETDCWIHAVGLEIGFCSELAGGGPPLGWSNAWEPEEKALVGGYRHVKSHWLPGFCWPNRGSQYELATLLS